MSDQEPFRTLSKGGHCDEDKAQVIALRKAGYGLDSISAQTGIARSTVYGWLCRFADIDIDDPELLREESRILKRAQALLHDYLEALESSDKTTLLKHGMTVNAIAGTRHDKLLASRRINQPTEDNRQLVIIIPGYQPVTNNDIEGELAEPGD